MNALNVTHADTGKFYIMVEQSGIRQEFKLDHSPTADDLIHLSAEMARQHFPIDDTIFTREITLDGTGQE